MKVWIRPRERFARKVIYDDLTKLGMSREEAKERLKKLGIFLSKGEIKKRGRPPKYDFLQVFISGVSLEEVNAIKEYLKRKLKRPVFLYPRDDSYVFIAPWRNAEGETLPYDILFFRKLKDDIERISRGKSLEVLTSTSWREDYEKLKKGKEEIPHDMEKLKGSVQGEREISHDMGKEEGKREIQEEVNKALLEVIKEEEEKKKREEELKEKLEKLREKRKTILNKIEYLEKMGRFLPGRLSEKRRLKKELQEVEDEIFEIENKLGIYTEYTKILKKMEI